MVSIPRSSKRVELKMGNGNGLLITNLGVVCKLLRPSWCPHPHASLIEETTERVRLAPTEDEDLATLSVVHKLILPQVKESGKKTNNLGGQGSPGSMCQSVIIGSLTLRDTKIRDFEVKFNFSKFRIEPVMLSFLAATENEKIKSERLNLQLREST